MILILSVNQKTMIYYVLTGSRKINNNLLALNVARKAIAIMNSSIQRREVRKKLTMLNARVYRMPIVKNATQWAASYVQTGQIS